MGGKSLLLVIVVVFAALFYWLSRSDPGPRTPGAVAIPARMVERKSPPAARTPAVSAPPPAIAAITRDLEQSRDAVENLQATLTTLRRERDQQATIVAGTSPARISSNELRIRSLTDRLRSLNESSDDLSAAAVDVLRERSAAARAEHDAIDAAIDQLRLSIPRLREDIQYMTLNRQSRPEDRELLAELRARLASQQAQINGLVARKSSTSTDLWRQIRRMNELIAEQRAAAAGDEDAIREEIDLLREDIDRLQTANERSRASLMSLDQRIEQTGRALEDEARRTRELEDSLRRSASAPGGDR